MTKKKVPKRLWDFGLIYEAELLSLMARERIEEQVTSQSLVKLLTSVNGLILSFTISFGGWTD